MSGNTPEKFAIQDVEANLEYLNDAVPLMKEMIDAIDKGHGLIEGESMIEIDQPGNLPNLRAQRNWKVGETIRLQIWEASTRNLLHLEIKGCRNHPLHPDPPKDELASHISKILKTVLPYVKNIKSASSSVMEPIDERLQAISVYKAKGEGVKAPSPFGDVELHRSITSATTEIELISPEESHTLWGDLPRICVINIASSRDRGVDIKIYPYILMTNQILDPIERLRLISTLPSKDIDNQEENSK